MRRIEVVSHETGEVVKVVDVTGRSERAIEKIERGVNINLDHERFYTREPAEDEDDGN